MQQHQEKSLMLPESDTKIIGINVHLLLKRALILKYLLLFLLFNFDW